MKIQKVEYSNNQSFKHGYDLYLLTERYANMKEIRKTIDDFYKAGPIFNVKKPWYKKLLYSIKETLKFSD